MTLQGEPDPGPLTVAGTTLELQSGMDVTLIAGDDGLQARGPFLEMFIPYGRITSITVDRGGAIVLDIDGTTVKLIVFDFDGRRSLLARLHRFQQVH